MGLNLSQQPWGTTKYILQAFSSVDIKGQTFTHRAWRRTRRGNFLERHLHKLPCTKATCPESESFFADPISRHSNRWLCPWLQASVITKAADINGSSSPWDFCGTSSHRLTLAQLCSPEKQLDRNGVFHDTRRAGRQAAGGQEVRQAGRLRAKQAEGHLVFCPILSFQIQRPVWNCEVNQMAVSPKAQSLSLGETAGGRREGGVGASSAAILNPAER